MALDKGRNDRDEVITTALAMTFRSHCAKKIKTQSIVASVVKLSVRRLKKNNVMDYNKLKEVPQPPHHGAVNNLRNGWS